MKPKAAIYHFTNGSKKRPKIYQDQMKTLEEFAGDIGFEVTETFCDFTLKRTERREYRRFMAECQKYDALVTKDFYHLAKNTGRFINDLLFLQGNGLEVHSMDNGSFTWENAPLDSHLNVATYACHFGSASEIREIIPVKNDVFELFIRKKTQWTLVDHYYDESRFQLDGEQVQMMRLIQNRKKYDLLLVHNLNEIHWRTANFCRIREQLKLDIYSLQEGFLAYRKKSQ